MQLPLLPEQGHVDRRPWVDLNERGVVAQLQFGDKPPAEPEADGAHEVGGRGHEVARRARRVYAEAAQVPILERVGAVEHDNRCATERGSERPHTGTGAATTIPIPIPIPIPNPIPIPITEPASRELG